MEREPCIIELAKIFPEGITGGEKGELLPRFFEKSRAIIIEKIKVNGTTDFELDFKDMDINLSEGLVAVRLLSVPVNKVGGRLILSNVGQHIIDMIEITDQQSHFQTIQEEGENPGPPYRIEVFSNR